MLRNLNVQILLTSFDVISFDVFDTLLLRPYVKPTDLFLRIELDAGVKGFAEDRVAGERRAGVARQPDDGRLHFRRRIEGSGVN